MVETSLRQHGSITFDGIKYTKLPCSLNEPVCPYDNLSPELTTPLSLGVWVLFSKIQTQKITGFSGPTGFDYKTILEILKLEGVPRTSRPLILDLLRHYESAMLEAIQTYRSDE